MTYDHDKTPAECLYNALQHVKQAKKSTDDVVFVQGLYDAEKQLESTLNGINRLTKEHVDKLRGHR